MNKTKKNKICNRSNNNNLMFNQQVKNKEAIVKKIKKIKNNFLMKKIKNQCKMMIIINILQTYLTLVN